MNSEAQAMPNRPPGFDSRGFLAGGGEMGERIRKFDWTTSPLGAPEAWPQSLKTIIRVMLDSRYAMWMMWGSELTFFCNDAYLPTVGLKRDWVLGARADKVWEEIWPDVSPRIAQVLERGEATWDEALLLFLERSGFPEETYHTFSYSPVYDDGNHIAGMLCVVTEVTERVIGERRLHVLRDLAARSSVVESVEESCRRSCAVLARYPYDIGFAALYLIEAGAQRAHCLVQVGGSPDIFPPTLTLNSGYSLWPAPALMATETAQELTDLPGAGIHTTANLWPDAVTQALVLPLRGSGQDGLTGFLIIGASPRRQFDDSYRDFFDLVAGQIGAALADAQAYEGERKRAQALAELDRAKTAFFSNVSHEFRTPLTLMLGPIEEILGATTTPPPIREQLELAHRNSLRLLKLVNSLLDFSRIEAGRELAFYEPTDLAAFTRDLASTFRSAIERAGLHFDVDCADLGASVYVDRNMWEKIVLNLLSNAFKFTLQGSISVRLRVEDGYAVFEVADTGAGIPAAELPKLFERFHRVENTQGRTHEGSGIGLALVHELIKLHGAAIVVSSELGAGSRFRIALPFGAEHLPADRVSAARPATTTPRTAQAFVEEALRWLPDAAAARHPLRAQHAQLDRRFAATFGARIVLADDNADMRAYVRELLAPFYAVEAVADGAQALAAARAHHPHLVLSDVMMPQLDGFGLLRALREDDVLRSVPVILLSARAGEEARIEGLDAGADDYLAKPFSARELLARVGALLELTQMRAENEGRLQLALSSIQDQFFVLDAEWRFTLVNPRVTALTGLKEHELIGKSFFDIFPETRNTVVDTELLATAKTRVARRFEFCDEPRKLWLEYNTYPAAAGVAVLIKNISAQIEARSALLEHQQRLEIADRQKDKFLAMLAHELRNPLAPIRNASELLALLVPPDSAAQPAIAMIKRQIAQMTRLVDDLLDVSRITQGRIELRMAPVDIAQVISQARETVEPLLEEKQQNLVMSSSYHQPLRVEGDFARLLQCVVNTLTNAIKYTDAGGDIHIHARAESEQAIIEISDNGVGIPTELLPLIFDLFVQSDRTLDRSEGGLGIGLSVVKGLMEMHRGEVTAHSAGLGQGSTFTLRLPLLKRAQTEAKTMHPAKPSPKRILVVDDNIDAADSLAMLLKLDGHTPRTAYNGEQALECLETFTPDIALLDIGLPEMNGYELAAKIREQPHLSSVRLIALTGYGQAEDRDRAYAASFDAHLVKPVEFNALRQAMEHGRDHKMQ